MPKPRRRIKKLCRPCRRGHSPGRSRQADRAVVAGRSARWTKGSLTRIWAERGSRPTAPRDQRYECAYLFGAVCPARGIGAGLVLPHANVDAMNLHLREISRWVSRDAFAVMTLD